MMLATLSLVMLLAEQPTTTLPRHADPSTDPASVEQRESADPLYDKPVGATDDAAFVLTAVESARQGVADAQAAEKGLPTPELRSAAATIGRQQQATLTKLVSLAKNKGWRLPEGNPQRTSTVPVSDATRTSADFIVHQIAFHQSTVEQFRAQIGGKGDAQLRRALREALPGYQKNLELLLGLKL